MKLAVLEVLRKLMQSDTEETILCVGRILRNLVGSSGMLVTRQAVWFTGVPRGGNYALCGQCAQSLYRNIQEHRIVLPSSPNYDRCAAFFQSCMCVPSSFLIHLCVLSCHVLVNVGGNSAVAVPLCFDHRHFIPTSAASAAQVANTFNIKGQISFTITIKAIELWRVIEAVIWTIREGCVG